MGRKRRRRRMTVSLDTLFKAKHWIRLLWRPTATGEEHWVIGQTTSRQLKYYSLPLYGLFRQKGKSPDEALLLVRRFIECLLDRRFNEKVDRERGRFRIFMREMADQFPPDGFDVNEDTIEAKNALRCLFPTEDYETWFEAQPHKDQPLDRVFDRGWSVVIHALSFTRLEAEYEAGKKMKIFRVVQQFLPGRGTAPSYSDVEAELGMSNFEVKEEVHMMKRVWREVVQTQVEVTLANPADIADELQYVTEILRT